MYYKPHINRMFHYHITLLALLPCLLSSLALANQDWSVPEYLEGASLINAEDLVDIQKTLHNLVIIDTREPADSGRDHTIQGAVQLTSEEATPSTLSRLLPDKSTPVVFFGEGESSIKSYKAAKNAINYGYVNVFWMRGGISEWMQKGLPLSLIHNPNNSATSAGLP